MPTTQPRFTAESRIADEVERFTGLNSSPVDPDRLTFGDRIGLQLVYAVATGNLIGLALGAVHLIRHGWTW